MDTIGHKEVTAIDYRTRGTDFTRSAISALGKYAMTRSVQYLAHYAEKHTADTVCDFSATVRALAQGSAPGGET